MTTEMRALSANEIDLVAGAGGFKVNVKNNDIAVNIASIDQANLSSVTWYGDVSKGSEVYYPTKQSNSAYVDQSASA